MSLDKLPQQPASSAVNPSAPADEKQKTSKTRRESIKTASDSIRTSFTNLTSTLSSVQHRAYPTAQRIASIAMDKIGMHRLLGNPNQQQDGPKEARRLSTPPATSFVMPNNEPVSLAKSMEHVKTLSSPENRVTLRKKLTNIQDVLEKCQSGDKKPKLLDDGTLVAVYTPIGGSHSGKSLASEEALHYITDTLNQAAHAGVTSGLTQTLKSFQALPQLRNRVKADSTLAVNLQQTMHAVAEADRATPPSVMKKDDMLDQVLLGHGPTSQLLLQSHQNNQNTRNLFKDLLERFDQTSMNANQLKMITGFNNILDLAEMYLDDKESLALGGKSRTEAKDQLTALAQKAIKSGYPDLKERGERLQTAINTEFTDSIELKKRQAAPIHAWQLRQISDQIKQSPDAEVLSQAQRMIAAATSHSKDNEEISKAIKTLRATITEIAIDKLPIPFSFENQSAESIADAASRELDAVWQSINPSEFNRLAWSKEDKADTAPNIVQHTAAFNGISQLVQQQVVTSADPKVVVEKVINAAYIAMKDGKFDSSIALLSGLKGNAIHRLKNTVWSQIDKDHQDKLDEMNAVQSEKLNFKDLRTAVNEHKGEGLQPHLALALGDLTKMDVNPDSLPIGDAEGVNLAKNRMMQSVKDDLLAHINRIKSRGAVSLNADFSASLKLLAMRQDPNDDALFAMSKIKEPRG